VISKQLKGEREKFNFSNPLISFSVSSSFRSFNDIERKENINKDFYKV
jgi:hypothetical protein